MTGKIKLRGEIKRAIQRHFEWEIVVLYSPHSVVTPMTKADREKLVKQKIKDATEDILSIIDKI